LLVVVKEPFSLEYTGFRSPAFHDNGAPGILAKRSVSFDFCRHAVEFEVLKQIGAAADIRANALHQWPDTGDLQGRIDFQKEGENRFPD
jgi:hypothetical protein